MYIYIFLALYLFIYFRVLLFSYSLPGRWDAAQRISVARDQVITAAGLFNGGI